MAFHLGSLGFLTPFEFDNFQEQVTNVLEGMRPLRIKKKMYLLLILIHRASDFLMPISTLLGHAALTLRSRLRCIILRKNDQNGKDSSKPPTNLLVSTQQQEALAVFTTVLN